MDTAANQSEQVEADLHYWHIAYFRRLEFKHHQAEILELAAVDPHDAEALLERGCPHELALEILT